MSPSGASPVSRRFSSARVTLRALPGLLGVGLFLVWSVHDGGYDAETWYWGALAMLALLITATICRDRGGDRMSRPGRLALILLTVYVGWSYLSILWAQAPGVALQGSNRSLLYLLLFALMVTVPWTAETALAALVVFAVGVGVIAIVLLVRCASSDHVQSLIVLGRLDTPTGYYNANAALFTGGALTCIAVALRRELPGPLRGLLLGFACADLQLALVVQSRGWLFTLPIIAGVTALVAADRLRLAVLALLPLAGVGAIASRLLAVFSSSSGNLSVTAAHAGHAGLLACAAVFVAGTLLAWSDWVLRERRLSRAVRRGLGTAVVGLALAGALGGAAVATHGHPVRFVVRQWDGFSHQQQQFSSGSHFGDVGSGRYDFWRVSLKAFITHPVGGLGQDNFADYYVLHRRTHEEPAWPHSLEMRLLAQTGIVGTLIFAAFVVAALAHAARVRRSGGLAGGVAAAACLPFVVWLIHGSIDWFWEMPALTGPALGFIAVAGAISAGRPAAPAAGGLAPGSPRSSPARGRRRTILSGTVASIAAAGAVTVLGLGYLSTREISLASDVAAGDPTSALSRLSLAASLDPLSATPESLGGAIALRAGRNTVALARFQQSIAREPGGWFAWFGAGIAASGLGDRAAARRYLLRAVAINGAQPVNQIALQRLRTAHPLTYTQAEKLFILVY